MTQTASTSIKRICMGAALVAISGTASAITFETTQFVVDSQYLSWSLVGNTLVEPHTNFLAWTSYANGYASQSGGHDGLSWTAKDGYAITGLSVSYVLRYDGASYAGTALNPAWSSSALFETSTGPATSFSGAGSSTTTVTHKILGTTLDVDLTLTAWGLQEFCPIGDTCSNGYGIWRATSIELQSVSVAPLVSAVPEPSTYALMFAGLSAISVAVRRKK